MMRRLSPLLALTGLLLSNAGAAQDRVLTPEAEEGFRRLIKLAGSGEAGAGVANANVAMQKSSARVELVLAAGGRKSFIVRPLESGGVVASHYFGISPDAGATTADAEALRALLDRCFPSDPFILPPQAGEADYAMRDAPSIGEAWKMGGLRSASLAALRASLRPASREFAYPVIGLHLLCLLGCLVLLGSARPTRS
jgi:hypothetical protein